MDFYKPTWQDVLGKPSQELNPVERYGLFDSPVAVIFGNKCYFSTGNVQDTIIGDGHPVRVFPKVSDNMLCVCQRWLAMYDPFGFIGLLNGIVEKRQFVFLT